MSVFLTVSVLPVNERRMKLRKAISENSSRFDEWIGQASSQKVADKLTIEKARFLCRNDLFYLGRVTGHALWKPGEVKGFVTPFHQDFCDIVSLMNWQLIHKGLFEIPVNEFDKIPSLLPVSDVVDDPKELGKARRLFLKFRSSYKSTIVTKLHTVQLLLNFPNIHICISHNTQINASDILTSVRDLIKKTALRHIFPELVPNTKDWGNTTGFSLKNKTDRIMTGDNVEAIGINTEVIGRKYHVFKNDDIVTEKSVTNEEQLRQSIHFIEMHKSLFVNPSVIIEDYSDTTYHFADATVVLQSDPDVETHLQPLLEPDTNGNISWQNKPHRCVLPEHFTVEGIGKEGVSGLMKDVDVFNLQYMLNPSSPRKVKFTTDMIRYYKTIPTGLNYYLVVDPADSEEKRACYTAMKIIGVDADDNWYWVDGVFDKIDDRERIDLALELAKKWKPYEVLWENLSFGRTDCRNFERRRREEGLNCQIREVGASRTSKDDRILGLNDRYSRKKIFWPPRLMYYSKFEGKTIDIVKAQEYEFIGFPLVSHKDLLDAESFMLQVDLIPGDKLKIEPAKYANLPPETRGATQVFWNDFDTWKENGFKSGDEVMALSEEDNY